MNPEVIACVVCCAVAAVGGLVALRLGTKPASAPPKPPAPPEEAVMDKAK